MHHYVMWPFENWGDEVSWKLIHVLRTLWKKKFLTQMPLTCLKIQFPRLVWVSSWVYIRWQALCQPCHFITGVTRFPLFSIHYFPCSKPGTFMSTYEYVWPAKLAENIFLKLPQLSLDDHMLLRTCLGNNLDKNGFSTLEWTLDDHFHTWFTLQSECQ